ncbi:MAG: hypothetical protein ACRDP6_44875 [Actinoallomurus sp.]
MRNPPEDHSLAVWIWPRALPLGEIFGAEWHGGEVRSRFLTLARQWQTRHPAPAPSAPAFPASAPPANHAGAPRPGQWMWHPPAHRIYDCHTYESRDGDWLEVFIQIGTADYSPGHCWTGASLAVACRCDSEHGHHLLVETRWRSGGPDATLDALTTVLRSTDEWLAGSRDPRWWRRQAGLASEPD